MKTDEIPYYLLSGFGLGLVWINSNLGAAIGVLIFLIAIEYERKRVK